MKRGRPPTTPRVHKGDLSDLIEATSNGLEGFNGNTLQFFHHIQVQFGFTPRQYLKWVTKFVSPWEVHDAKMSLLWRTLSLHRFR
jgi:hypothetical protein